AEPVARDPASPHGLKTVARAVITGVATLSRHPHTFIRQEWPVAMRFRRPLALLAALLWAGLAAADPAATSIPEPPAAVTKAAPESIDDLKAFQEQTRAVLDKVIPATVCLRVGQASGSGVIVSRDGLIMTAGHVSGEPGKKIKVVLHDGKTVDGETLGFGPAIDSRMLQIPRPRPLPP